MLDKYRRSQEEQQAALETILRKMYPGLEFDRFEWIDDPNTHLAIDDLTFRTRNEIVRGALQELVNTCQGKLRTLSLAALTAGLMKDINSILDDCDPKTTLFVFPGEGAVSVRDVLPQGVRPDIPSIVIRAKRIKNMTTGVVEGIDVPNVREDLAQATKSMKVENVLVVDDVIDTGKTLRTIQQMAGLTQANWFAATPIMFSPLPYEGRDTSPSSIEGYKRVFASLLLQGQVNPVPLNSLSSFVEGGQKTQRLIGKCLNNYVAPEQQVIFVDSLLRLSKALR